MTRRRWRAFAGAAAVSLLLASPAHAQLETRKCSAPAVSADERMAACTAMIEAGAGGFRVLSYAYGVRAKIYLSRRDFEHAIADYSQIIKFYPENRFAYIGRGVAYRESNDCDHAIADFDRVIRLDPQDQLGYLHRAIAYQLSHRMSEANVDYEHVIELNPNSPLVYQARGTIHLRENDLDPAIADFSQAIKLHPTFEPAYVLRGEAYLAKGDPDHAVADLDKAIELNPNDKQAYTRRSGAFEAKDDFVRAIADSDEVIRLDPANARAYRDRATKYVGAGSLANALTDLDRSEKLDPRDPYTALWREITAKRSDQPSRLSQQAAQLDMTKWPAPVVRLFLGDMKPEELLAAADNPDPRTKKGQVCEANFYSGEQALQQGAKEEAVRLFRVAAADCPKTFVEWRAAYAELKAMNAKP